MKSAGNLAFNRHCTIMNITVKWESLDDEIKEYWEEVASAALSPIVTHSVFRGRCAACNGQQRSNPMGSWEHAPNCVLKEHLK